LLQTLCSIIGVTLILQALVNVISPDWVLPRKVMLPGSFFVLLVLLAWRLIFHQAIHNAIGARRVLFIGISPIGADLAAHFNGHPELGFKSIGYLEGAHNTPDLEPALPRLGHLPDLLQVVDEWAPNWILVSERKEVRPGWVNTFLELRFGGVETAGVAEVYETTFGRVCLSELPVSELIFADILGAPSISRKLQSGYSFALALLLLIVLSPLMILIAILIKVNSPGSILLREQRVGQDGALFTSYRFRWKYDRPGVPQPTVLGKFLRRFCLDDLPQLWNVLSGRMALVGPRPTRPEFASRLRQEVPLYRQRYSLRPGITGWAQINTSTEPTTLPDALAELEYDLYYMKNLSPTLDLLILIRSAKLAVLGS
jgi:lipopolysaccharide/colanic/teichoic acid biosynthesis glycosyltransferase